MTQPEAELSTAVEVSRALQEAGIGALSPPSADIARMIVRTLRRLAEGRPISTAELAELASDFGSADEVIGFVERMCERDADGNVVGYVGLSLADHPHVFEVDGRALRTWCAWDSLFLPPMLGKTAQVTSRDPATGKEVRLTSTPDGVVHPDPDGMVVSVVIPRIEAGARVKAMELQEVFCDFVHFFTDLDTAVGWFAGRGMDVRFVTLDQAVELGRLRFADVIAEAGQEPLRPTPAFNSGTASRARRS